MQLDEDSRYQGSVLGTFLSRDTMTLVLVWNLAETRLTVGVLGTHLPSLHCPSLPLVAIPAQGTRMLQGREWGRSCRPQAVVGLRTCPGALVRWEGDGSQRWSSPRPLRC